MNSTKVSSKWLLSPQAKPYHQGLNRALFQTATQSPHEPAKFKQFLNQTQTSMMGDSQMMLTNMSLKSNSGGPFHQAMMTHHGNAE